MAGSSGAYGWSASIAFSPVLVLAAGCILAVSPERLGEHCQFAARDSTCGSCVATHCQDQVDRVCAAGSEAVLADLEACATTRDAHCTALVDGGRADAADLAACVSARCPGACAPTAGTSTTRCIPEPFGDGRACSCTTTSTSNDYVCAESVLRDSICCAPEGWPGVGLSCSCQPLTCNPQTTGCSCFLTNYVAQSEICTGGKCCASGSGCKCGARECGAGERSVEKCSISEVECAAGQHRVASCSVSQP